MLYPSFEKIASQVFRSPPKGRDLIPAVVDWLESTKEEWLLVVDNYNKGDLSSILPGPGRGNILFTSTRHDLLPRPPPRLGRYIVPEMGEDDSVTLLLRAAELDADGEDLRNRAKPLVKELGHLPLALDHAGAQMRASRYSPEIYTASLRQNKKRLLGDPNFKKKSEQELTVYATFDLSLKRLRTYAAGSPEDSEQAIAYKSALELLNAFCFYHHDDIDLEILLRANCNLYYANRMDDIWETVEITDSESVQSNASQGRESIESREAIENIVLGLCPESHSVDFEYIFDGISLLLRHSFLKPAVDNPTAYKIHPLVHSWLRDRMDHGTYKANFRLARTVLYAAFDPEMHDVHSSRFYLSMLPHVQANSSYCPQKGSRKGSNLEEAEISSKHARILSHSHLWKDAIPYFEKAVRGLFREIDPSSAATLGNMMDLGTAYMTVGRVGDAVNIYLEVIERAACCNDDIRAARVHVIDAESELSMALLIQGEFAAKHMAELVVQMARKSGVRSLRPLDRLCLMLQYTGDWQEAEELADLIVRVRTEQKKKHGPEHRETLRAVVELARIRARRGKTDQATQDLASVVDKFEKDLGPHHMDTVIAKSELAWVYHLQGGKRLKEAEKMQRTSLKEGLVALGTKHPYTLLIVFRLGLTLGERGRYSEAEIYMRNCRRVRREVFGPKHPAFAGTHAAWKVILSKQEGPGYLERLGFTENNTEVLDDLLRWGEYPWMHVEGTSSTFRVAIWNRYAKECIKT